MRLETPSSTSGVLPLARAACVVGARGLTPLFAAGLSCDSAVLRVFRLFIVTWFETVRARWKRGPLRPTWSLTMEWIVRYLRRDWDDTANWEFARLRRDTNARPYSRGM